MILLLAALLAQPSLNLNQQPIMSRQNGARLSTTRQFAIDCYGGTACSVDGGVLRIWTADAGASSPGGTSDYDGGYLVVQDEGGSLTRRSTIDFTGAGVTCTDTGAKTACDIPSGGSGGASPLSLILGTP